MTEQNEEQGINYRVTVDFFPKPDPDDDTLEIITVREVVLGYGPQVVIDFNDVSEGAKEILGISVSSSGLDKDGLIELFEDLAEVLKSEPEGTNDGED